MGISVTKEQYRQACSADLYKYLVHTHPSEIKVEYGSALLRDEIHVSVKNGYHGYMNFKTGETGNNIDYLMRFLGYRYQDAVLALIGESAETITSSSVHQKVCVPADGHLSLQQKEIVLPEPLEGPYRQMYAYMKARMIPGDMIQDLIKRGVLYQSAQGCNMVFVTPQHDYCEIRGTNTYADRRCKHRQDCDNYNSGDHAWCTLMYECGRYKPNPFHGCRRTRPDRFWYYDSAPGTAAKNIYVCEAAIDAVSLYVIHMAQGKADYSVYVSIGGAANQKPIDRLVRQCRDRTIILAVDNDDAGKECRERNENLDYILPTLKDWNEDLMKGVY